MSRNPLVSTIIPTYNRGDVICAAIESVLNQTYSNVEIIVVDDGSTDDTQVKLRCYGNKIKVIRQVNAGVSYALNRGIESAQGDIIAFLGSDDLWSATKLERQVAVLEASSRSVTCCLCNMTLRGSNGRLRRSFELADLDPPYEEGIWLNVAEVLATRFVMFQQAAAIRREVLERIGGFNENFWFLEDYEFALRLSLEGPWAFVREPLAIWNESTPDSLSQKAQSNEFGLLERIVEIGERFLSKLEGYQYAGVRRNLKRELKRARRRLRAVRVGQMNFFGAPTLGNILRNVERCRKFAFHRSPWFPGMETVPLDG